MNFKKAKVDIFPDGNWQQWGKLYIHSKVDHLLLVTELVHRYSCEKTVTKWSKNRHQHLSLTSLLSTLISWSLCHNIYMFIIYSTLEQRLQGKRGGKQSMLDQYNQQKEQAALFQYKKGAIEDEYEVGKELGGFLGISLFGEIILLANCATIWSVNFRIWSVCCCQAIKTQNNWPMLCWKIHQKKESKNFKKGWCQVCSFYAPVFTTSFKNWHWKNFPI